MKNIKYILSFVVITLFIFGCDVRTPSEDPEPIGSTDSYPTPTFTLSSGMLTSNEKDEMVIVYDVELDKPIDRPINFSWVVLDGTTATLHDDYDLENATVEAYTTTGQLSIILHSDTVAEDTESLLLTIESGPSIANRYLVNPDTQYPNVNVSIENWDGCVWTLFTWDTYGDGWNGGFITLETDGTSTDYAEDDDVPTTFEIFIGEGDDYTFTYTSGGGTGGSPGWESENYYLLTAPDGTEWEDGSQDYSGIPTEGVITTGTNNCP